MPERLRKIALACDHAGFAHKQKVKEHLSARGFEVEDFGTYSSKAADYPLFIRPAAEAVASGACDGGIVFGGSGNGEAMVANKVRGIRCAVCWNEASARLAREHNDANMISIGQRLIPLDTAVAIVDTWLTAKFKGGRHQRRIEQME
jgi:ribose 5-phosphate isomerase B